MGRPTTQQHRRALQLLGLDSNWRVWAISAPAVGHNLDEIPVGEFGVLFTRNDRVKSIIARNTPLHLFLPFSDISFDLSLL